MTCGCHGRHALEKTSHVCLYIDWTPTWAPLASQAAALSIHQGPGPGPGDFVSLLSTGVPSVRVGDKNSTILRALRVTKAFENLNLNSLFAMSEYNRRQAQSCSSSFFVWLNRLSAWGPNPLKQAFEGFIWENSFKETLNRKNKALELRA